MRCLLLLIALASASAATPANFDEIAAAAKAAQDANHPAEALRLYRRALALRPSWQDGWWAVGTLHYDQDQYPEARDALKRLVALNSDAGPGFSLLGICEYRTQEYDSALAHLGRGYTLGVRGKGSLAQVAEYHLIALLTRAGHFEAALEKLTELMASGADEDAPTTAAAGLAALRRPMLPADVPEKDRALITAAGKAVLNTLARRPEKAEADFKALVETYPSTPNVHYSYGAYLLVADPDRALAELKQELVISPHHLPALVAIAVEYLRRTDGAAALPFAREAVESYPESFEAHNVLGRALVETGQLESGMKELQLSAALAPDSPQTHFALAAAYAKAGRKAEAAKERAEFLRLRNEITQ